LGQFAEAFREAGFDAGAFYPCYGLAESTLLAAGAHHAHEPTITAVNRPALAQHRVVAANGEPPGQIQRLVGCGTAMPGHELLIVDPVSDLPRGEHQVGEILLRGPSVAMGYWNRPEETETTFGACIGGYEGAFLRTGDLGFVSGGELFVTGRLKDIIIIRGRNHYPQDIEQTVQSAHAAVLPGAAFSVPIDGEEQLIIVHQVDRQYRGENCDEVVRAIRRAIVENHELDPYAILLIRQTSLPITSSGKVQRSLCREQYLSGELKIVREWTRPAARKRTAGLGTSAAKLLGPAVHSATYGHKEWRIDGSGVRQVQPHSAMEIDRRAERIETWLLEWLVERVGLNPEDVERNRPFAEFGVDSLTSLELSDELESEFGVELTPIIAWNYPTPSALAHYLAQQTAKAEAGGSSFDSVAVTLSRPAAQTTDTQGRDSQNADWEKLLSEIESLSDEEAASLLGSR
jgi:acyl carrier protein